MQRSERQRFVFVGECRSFTAIRKDWSWADGRLAAKPLFEALRAIGVDPDHQQFVNLFTDPPLTRRHVRKWRPTVNEGIIAGLLVTPWVVVALGQRVSSVLVEREIEHVALVHPAARGRIRKRERYIAHVSEKLGRAA